MAPLRALQFETMHLHVIEIIIVTRGNLGKLKVRERATSTCKLHVQQAKGTF